MRVLNIRVAGVSFDGRQQLIEHIHVWDTVQILAEPENAYDENALAVKVATATEGVVHIGYIPRELAADLAPYLEGETLIAEVCEITGGFDKPDGSKASYGVRLRIEIPD